MKKTILFCLAFLALCCTSSLFAQQVNPVSGVSAKPNADQDKVTITFNLQPNARIRCYCVALKITMDGQPVTTSATSLTGDVGQCVFPGLGKKVTWDALLDVTELSGELKVDVTAIGVPIPCQKLNAVPVYAGLGGVGASGLGLILAGLTQESQSRELYDVYKSNLDPSSSVFNELSRTEHYDEANSKHKTGQIMTWGGVGVLAVGGYMLVSRLIAVNRYNKLCDQGSSSPPTCYDPIYRVEPVIITNRGLSGGGNTFGLSFSYRF